MILNDHIPKAMPTSSFSTDKIWSVHLELTTRCNALCPMCPRTGKGTVRRGLRLTELSLENIRRIFPLTILERLHRIDICGGFGDPLMASDFDDIIAYFRAANPDLALYIFTNASLRPSRWWGRLPEGIGRLGKVIFGIDGLADTHSIYRVGTSFATILKNARAFIEAGGHAQWDFLIFRHNQHQVDAARALAQSLGFKAFSPKVSGRFFKRYYEETPELEAQHGCEKFPTYDRDGVYLRDLELPTDPRFRNPTLVKMKAEVASRGSLRPLLDGGCIECRAINDRSLFVSAEGTVFPCCWTYGASKYGQVFGMKDAENLRIADLLEECGGPDAINAKFRPIEEIIEGPFFRAIERSWGAGSIAEGKPKICARMCGEHFSQNDQFVDPSLSPWRKPEK